MPIHPEVELFWNYITGLVDRIIACLDGLEGDDLSWKPLDNANSLYVLATHTMGNVEENLLKILCGQEVRRVRAEEFLAQGDTAEPVRQRWHDLRERVHAALAQLPPGELERKRQHPHRGQITGREVMMVVMRHAAEHTGHAEMTRDLLFVARGKTPPYREF